MLPPQDILSPLVLLLYDASEGAAGGARLGSVNLQLTAPEIHRLLKCILQKLHLFMPLSRVAES